MTALYKLFLLLERQRVWNKWTGSTGKHASVQESDVQQERGEERRGENESIRYTTEIRKERTRKKMRKDAEKRKKHQIKMGRGRGEYDLLSIFKPPEFQRRQSKVWGSSEEPSSLLVYLSMLQAFSEPWALEAETRADICNLVYCSAV